MKTAGNLPVIIGSHTGLLLENTAEVTKIGISYHVGYLIYVIGRSFQQFFRFLNTQIGKKIREIFAGCLFDQSADIRSTSVKFIGDTV